MSTTFKQTVIKAVAAYAILVSAACGVEPHRAGHTAASAPGATAPAPAPVVAANPSEPAVAPVAQTGNYSCAVDETIAFNDGLSTEGFAVVINVNVLSNGQELGTVAVHFDGVAAHTGVVNGWVQDNWQTQIVDDAPCVGTDGVQAPWVFDVGATGFYLSNNAGCIKTPLWFIPFSLCKAQ